MSQDEDLARAWLEIPEDERPAAVVRARDFNPELAAIHDRLAELLAVTINANSKSGGHKPHYAERPEAAIKRLEEELSVARVEAVMGSWMD